MPSEVLDYFREKDPRFKSVSDADLTAYIKEKYPSFAKELTPGPVLSTRQKAGQRLSRLKTDELAEEREKYGTKGLEAALSATQTGAKLGAEMLPFAAAAPFTAGASLPAGLAIMGGAGLASGIVRETISAAEGKRKPPAQIARSLALDAVLGGGTELGIVGLKNLAKLGGPLWERFVMQAAQKSQKGRELLVDAEVNAYQPLEAAVKGREADVKAAYESFLDKLAKIPHGKGAVGKKLAGGVGGQLGELAAGMSQDIAMSGTKPIIEIGPVEVVSAGYGHPAVDASHLLTEGKALTAPGGFPGFRFHLPHADLTKQPLDALIRMHSNANKMARAVEGEAPEPAQKAARELAKDLNDIILKKLRSNEVPLYNAAKEITQKRLEYNLAQQAMRHSLGMIMRKALGTVVGLEFVEKKYGPAMLESWIRNNKASYQRAIQRLVNGETTVEEVGNWIASGTARAVPAEMMERIKEELLAQKVTVPSAP